MLHRYHVQFNAISFVLVVVLSTLTLQKSYPMNRLLLLVFVSCPDILVLLNFLSICFRIFRISFVDPTSN